MSGIYISGVKMPEKTNLLFFVYGGTVKLKGLRGIVHFYYMV